MVAPKDTPVEIVGKLNSEITASLSDPKIMAQFANVGSVPKAMTPAEFGKFVVADTEKWAKVIKGADIKVD